MYDNKTWQTTVKLESTSTAKLLQNWQDGNIHPNSHLAIRLKFSTHAFRSQISPWLADNVAFAKWKTTKQLQLWPELTPSCQSHKNLASNITTTVYIYAPNLSESVFKSPLSKIQIRLNSNFKFQQLVAAPEINVNVDAHCSCKPSLSTGMQTVS